MTNSDNNIHNAEESSIADTGVTDKASELKPCLFCGCMGRLHISRNAFKRELGRPVAYRIECEGACHSMTCWWHTEQEALDAWNTRPTPVDDKLVEDMDVYLSGKPIGCDASFISWSTDGQMLLKRALTALSSTDTVTISRECAEWLAEKVEMSSHGYNKELLDSLGGDK